MHISTAHAVESQAPATSQARAAQATTPTQAAEREANPDAEDARPAKSVNPAAEAARLSEAELRQVQQLKARDREVRAHEQAHLAAGGSMTRGGATYTYEKGPDGKRYAVAGEVQLQSARVPGDPEATAERAAQVQRAATAPASPSAQDRAVAAEAAALATRARAEARTEARAETRAEAAAETTETGARPRTETRDDASAPAESVLADRDAGGAIQPPATGAQTRGEAPSSPSKADTDPADTPENARLSLYEQVASIDERQPSSPSIFEPVLA